MLEVHLVLDSNCVLHDLNLLGHAGDMPRGENLACAAISLMVRSIARLLTSQSGFLIEGDAPEPGKLTLHVRQYPKNKIPWLKGVTDTLLKALNDINEEYPSALSIHIEEK